MTTTPTTITTIDILDSDGDVATVPAVRLWDVYQQVWAVYPLSSVPERVLASLPAEERAFVTSMSARAELAGDTAR